MTLVERATKARADMGEDAPPLDIAEVRTSEVTAYAQGFLDAVRERSLEWYRAPGDEGAAPDLLTESVLTVTRRRVGSMGGWGFGGDDPTPTEAAAIARWAAQTAVQEEEGDMEVYY